jgi:hypothetical protein
VRIPPLGLVWLHTNPPHPPGLGGIEVDGVDLCAAKQSLNMPSPSLPTVFSVAIHGKGIVRFFVPRWTIFVLLCLLACRILLSIVATVPFLLWRDMCLLFLPCPWNPVCQPKRTLWLLLLYQRSILLSSRVLPFHFRIMSCMDMDLCLCHLGYCYRLNAKIHCSPAWIIVVLLHKHSMDNYSNALSSSKVIR